MWDWIKSLFTKTPPIPAPIVVPPPVPATIFFNDYILEACNFLDKNYGALGYNVNKAITHDIQYGKFGYVKGSDTHQTMCVAACLEVILTAMNLYAHDTNDQSVFEFLPKRSWEGFSPNDIKAHIWVDPKLKSYGTPDALTHFGMGSLIEFEKLQPGSFIGMNRTDGLGHAVVFIHYIDILGNEIKEYNANIVKGFKFFSSQGSTPERKSGLGYQYVFFAPLMPTPYDFKTKRKFYPGIIYSTNQKYLNCGQMWHPSRWDKSIRPGVNHIVAMVGPKTKLNDRFDHDHTIA